MSFTQLYHYGINLVKSNIGKSIIVGSTILILGYEGYNNYKIRQETIKSYRNLNIKYNNREEGLQLKPIQNQKILENEFIKNKIDRDNKIITMCFQKELTMDSDILSIDEKYLQECDDLFFIPENIIEIKNKSDNNYVKSVVKLLSNEYYLSRLNKINPNYIISFFNHYEDAIDIENTYKHALKITPYSIYDDNDEVDYIYDSYKYTLSKNFMICNLITSITKNNTLKNIILDKFNDLYLPVKIKVIQTMMKNINNCTTHENKIISDFFKDYNNLEKYIINLDKYILQNDNTSLDVINEILSKFTNIQDPKQYFIDLIVSGKYQIDGNYMKKIPDYILKNNDNVEKLLMNQHNLNDDQITLLKIIYETENKNLTPYDVFLFIKKYQPDFFRKYKSYYINELCK